MRAFCKLLAIICLLAGVGCAEDPPSRSVAIPAHVSNTFQNAATWLSKQLGQPVLANQIHYAPPALEGCNIKESRTTPTGLTSLSLRCPSQTLPRLMLVDSGIKDFQLNSKTSRESPRKNLSDGVHAGSSLVAELKTESMHASFAVVAMESGLRGDEIRVRIARTNRFLKALILSAHEVQIVGGRI